MKKSVEVNEERFEFLPYIVNRRYCMDIKCTEFETMTR